MSIVAENLDGVTTLTVVSERLRQEQAQLRIRTMDFSGHVVREETIAFTALANTATKIKQYQNDELLQGLAANKHFVLIDLIQNGKVVSYEELYFVAAKDQALSTPKIQQQWKKVGDHVVLSLKSKELTRMLELDFGKLEAKLSDNFVTLLPGQSIDIRIHSKADLSQLTQALRFRSLHPH
jgi:beta-mannosidase